MSLIDDETADLQSAVRGAVTEAASKVAAARRVRGLVASRGREVARSQGEVATTR
jgi:cytidylate kinase